MKEIIYGKNSVQETLNSGRKVFKLNVMKNTTDKKIISLAEKKGINVNYVERNILDKMVKGNHQGFVAEVEAYKYASMEDLFANVKADEQPFFIILDQLEDPHNLGAIIRTVDCSGAHGIILPKDNSVGLNATVGRASVGAIEHVPVCQVTNINQTIKELKKRGLWIVGTDVLDSTDYRSVDYNMPMALVIGNEGRGMRKLVRDNCDFLVHIPMRGTTNSLNASVAAALLMYQVLNSRNPI